MAAAPITVLARSVGKNFWDTATKIPLVTKAVRASTRITGLKSASRLDCDTTMKISAGVAA